MLAHARGTTLYGVVPNFSEGRRRDVIDAIVDALHVPGARVVFAEADPDHNRLDTTVLGCRRRRARRARSPAPRVAVELIDMTDAPRAVIRGWAPSTWSRSCRSAT